MVSNKTEDAALDSLFAAAQSERPVLSSEFMARLNADAAIAGPTAAPATQHTSISVFARLRTLFAASGLSGAAALGLWLGFVMPDLVTPFSAAADDASGISAFLTDSDFSVLSE